MTTAQLPPVPAVARAVFGERLEVAAAYVALLADTGISHGLLGPREVPRLWDRHVLNCAVLSELVGPDETCIDVGSGAGLPGLAVAIARPDLQVVLVEPLARRARWLEHAVGHLGLTGVQVRCCRAEALHGTVSAPVVTARAVANLTTLAGWCLPLVSAGGRLLAIKGARAGEELAESITALQRLGVVGAEVRQCGVGIVDPATQVVELVAGQASRVADARGSRGGRGGSGGRGSARGSGGAHRPS